MRPNIGPAAAGPAGPVATALRCQWVVGTEIHQQETQKHNRGSAGSHSQIEKNTHKAPGADNNNGRGNSSSRECRCGALAETARGAGQKKD